MSYSSEVLADTPVGYWRLGETSGTAAADSSGGGFHGTYTGGVALDYPGIADDGNRSALFDGSNDYVTMGDVLDQTGSLTLEAWIRSDDIALALPQRVIAKDDAAAVNGWLLSVTAGTGLINFATRSLSNVTLLTSAGFLTSGHWHHLVGVWDAAAGTKKVYIDGVERASVSGVTGSLAAHTGPLNIGSDHTPANFFKGKIDEAAIYAAALSPTRIAAHYAAARRPTHTFIEVMWDALVWTDETDYRITADWSNGRDYASQLTARASAGQLDVLLRNPDGRFASLNSAGPLFGKLLPGRKVRVVQVFPLDVTLWQGFIDEIRPSPGGRDSAPTVVLRASGPLKWIAARKASTAVYTSILTGTAVGHILDDAGWPAADRAIDAGNITMNRWKADGDSALSHLQELEEMEIGAYIGESRDGRIVFEDANHRAVSPHSVSQATFSDAQGASLSYDQIEQLDPWAEIFNRADADVTLYTTQSLAVLWSLTGETPSIAAGATKDFWVSYPTPDSALQADHVDAWTTPAATTDFLANTQADGLGTNKTAAITVATSKFANSMKIALTNTDAGAVFITFLQARGTAVYKNDPIRVVAEDTASQAKYGKRSFPLPGKFFPSTTVAQSYVDAVVSRYKDPLAIVRISYQANMDAAHMTQALTRSVSDRISVRAQGTLASGAQLGINTDFFIESERHHYDLSGHWTTYELSDARTVTGYWILGTSDLGNTTKLGL